MGLIVCPSRELARQTHEVIQGYTTAMKEDGLPELRSLLVMGGIDMRTQVRSPVPSLCHHELAKNCHSTPCNAQALPESVLPFYAPPACCDSSNVGAFNP